MHVELCESVRRADLALASTDLDSKPALLRLVHFADEADRPTPRHVHRVASLSEALALHVGWAADDARALRTAATLHDIGKAGLPRELLSADRQLTAEERARMELHTLLGAAVFAGVRTSPLRTARLVALHHHERWDGRGYPHRLKGERIPEAARIVAIADVYDALATDRPYRRALPHAHVLDHISQWAGNHFDPDLSAAFLQVVRDLPSAREAA